MTLTLSTPSTLNPKKTANMTDFLHHQQSPYYGGGWQHYNQQDQPLVHQVAKAVTAVAIGGSLLVLSALTLTATVIGLTVITPLLVIFSPVIVPAVITTFFIVAGFVTSGGFGVAAIAIMAWMYKYVTGRHPVGADQLDEARMKISGKARDWRDRADLQFGAHGQNVGARQGA